MIKKTLALLVLITLLVSTMVTPNNIQAMSDSTEKVNLNIGGEEINISKKFSSNEKEILEINTDYSNSIVSVFFETGDIIVTLDNGTTETYNVKDFEVDSKDESNFSTMKSLNESNFSNQIQPLKVASGRNYLTDINASLGFGSKSTWTRGQAYTYPGAFVDVYDGVYWKYTKTPQKYSFTRGTTVGVIVGVVVAISGSSAVFTVATLSAVLKSIGVSLATDVLAQSISPSIGVKQKQVGRGFMVRGKGFTLATKTWYNYLEIVEKGEIGLKSYSSGQYQQWYNNYSDKNVSEVAFQQYRYIIGQRSSAPHGSEFSWRFQ